LVIDPEFHYQMINVETQQGNVHSLLWWMKRLFALRKEHRAFSRGSLEMLTADNPKTLAFIRHWPPQPTVRSGGVGSEERPASLLPPHGESFPGEEEHILVVANLSRFVQCTRIDMSAYKGMTPIEMMGRTAFPVIGETPYLLTLGPHTFYWFVLKPQPAAPPGTVEPPLLAIASPDWTGVFRGRGRQALQEALPAYLWSRPWFQGRLRLLTSATLREVIPLGPASDAPRLALVQTDYDEGEPEVYLLPLAFAPEKKEEQGVKSVEEKPVLTSSLPPPPSSLSVIARLRVRAQTEGEPVNGVLYDPSGERGFVAALLELFGRGGRCEGEAGDLRAESLRPFPHEPPPADLRLLESSNTVVILGDRQLLKLYRRIEEGIQPEVEMNRVLLAKTSFYTHVPPLAAALQYHPAERGEPATLGVLQEYAANEGDAWRLTLDALQRFFDHILAGGTGPPQIEAGPRSLVELSDQDIPGEVRELLGSYLETARLLARRTAELHVALASVRDDPDFVPEPFTGQYQRSLYQSMRGRIRQTLPVLRQRLASWPEALREPARRVAYSEDRLMRLAHRIFDRLIEAPRIRCHGHLHLGHLLFTGKDFLVIDLEGEADRSIPHRRRKRSPTRDLASLHRSLQEATVAALQQGVVRLEDVPALEPWARFWQRWASVVFLKEYRAVPGTAELLPRDPTSLAMLLDFYRLGWNISGLRHELANRTERAPMLLRNLIQMLERA